MGDPVELPPSTCEPLPLFVRLAGAGLACLAAVLLMAVVDHRLLRLVDLSNLSVYLILGTILAAGYTAIEALCQSGWRRVALGAGLSLGPSTAFALSYGAGRLQGASSYEAMLEAGRWLASPDGWWQAALFSLLLAGSLGALLWGQRESGHPVANAAGVCLVAATIFLALAPVTLPPPDPYYQLFLASRALWLLVLPCAIPQLLPRCARAARWTWEHAGAPPASWPRPWLLSRRGARGALDRIWRALSTRSDPCAGPERGLREALRVYAPLLSLLGGWLALAALLEPALDALSRGAPGFDLWAPGAGSDASRLKLARAVALLTSGSGLLLWRIQVGSLPRPRMALAVAIWAGGLTLNLAVVLSRSDSSWAGLGFVVAVGTLGVAGGTGLASWRPVLAFIGAETSLAAAAVWTHADLSAALWLVEWAWAGPYPRLFVAMGGGLAVVLIAAWRWGIQPSLVGGTAAGSTLVGCGVMSHTLRWGWSSEGAGWSWPDEVLVDGVVWGLVGGLAGGAAGRLLDRATPRYATPISLALLGAALALALTWCRSAEPPRDRDLLRLQARAEAGDPVAMLRLGQGMLVRAQDSRPEDLQAAVRWYRRAAEAGLPHGMHRWGCLLQAGRYTPRRSAEGRAWLERAAASGWPGAQERLRWELVRSAEERWRHR